MDNALPQRTFHVLQKIDRLYRTRNLMTELQSYLLTNIFYRFIRGEPEISRAIDEFDGNLRIIGNALTFSLPALFEFVCQSYEKSAGEKVASDRSSYLRFRKILYSSPINRAVKAHGGHIEIASANSDHDLRRYKLVRD